jgi:hypothetical protein
MAAAHKIRIGHPPFARRKIAPSTPQVRKTNGMTLETPNTIVKSFPA